MNKETQSLDFTRSDTEIGVDYGNMFGFHLILSKQREVKGRKLIVTLTARLDFRCFADMSRPVGQQRGCRVKGFQKSEGCSCQWEGRK